MQTQPEWLPAAGSVKPAPVRAVSAFSGAEVLTCSRMIGLSGSYMGWVHVGISLQSHEQALAHRTGR